ncbi:ubiquitin thioesterase ZRANB1 [Lethenteron reissneri]|uniref:ubiquitin thioesterase ZRANB1 n=1 Tax=Lethenteron reissneri TaxID=7753 RepID=UPI002AB626DD|nr:ubiquitin thioesterase ZRANB1 [Lethenteron reissneri]
MSDGGRKWGCDYCTYENWPSAIKCTMCRAPRRSPSIISPPEAGTPGSPDDGRWRRVLTDVSPSGRGGGPSGGTPIICPDADDVVGGGGGLGGLGGLGGGNLTADSAGKWSCATCTYMNWQRTARCSQCLTQRGGCRTVTATIAAQRSPRGGSPGDSPGASTTCVARHRRGGGASPVSPEHVEEILNNDRNRAAAPPALAPPPSAPAPPPTSRAPVSPKWMCATCTYENWPKSLKCSVCAHPRPNNYEAVEPERVAIDARDAERAAALIEQERARRHAAGGGTGGVVGLVGAGGGGGGCGAGMRRSPSSSRRDPDSPLLDVPRIEFAGAVGNNRKEDREVDFKRLKQIKNRMRKTDWLFLNACLGVVEGDFAAVEAYKSCGSDIARQLTGDEVRLLNRPSAFDTGHTLVHLAIRFQQQDILAMLLAEVSQHAAKRIPAFVCPELTELIRREVATSLHQRKGDFPCHFLSDLLTFTLPAEIEELPGRVQEKLYDELLDRDVQKELEEESPIINWSLELSERLESRLYALWNRTAGDCLLDSVLQATWGIDDKDCVLRSALRDSLHDCSHWFYTRWKEWESWSSQSFGLHFSLREEQWQEDWAFILSLASQPGSSLEHTHIFVLAHVLRRPIIVYGVKFYKSFRGETLGYARFQGVYLPVLWEASFCWKSPIALGYTRGHFSALVPMESEGYVSPGAGANIGGGGGGGGGGEDEGTVTFLPLVDSERKLLPVHFLSACEIGNEENQERLLRHWLDCCVTEGGILVARQRVSRRRHPLVTQMLDKWLERYRHLQPRGPGRALSDGEEEDEEDE